MLMKKILNMKLKLYCEILNQSHHSFDNRTYNCEIEYFNVRRA